MRRLRAIGVCAVLLLALGGAAAPAQAAPSVRVDPWCDEANYGIAVTLSGFPPDSEVGASITSDVYNLGPIFYHADGSGGVAPIKLGSTAPFGSVTITAFADLDGDQAPGPGEPTATGTIEQPCGQRPLPGGAVTGSAAGTLDDGTTAGFSFAAHSGAHGEDPGGSVSETRSGQTFVGTVTCVAVRRATATVGVAFAGGGPGGTPAAVYRIANEDAQFRTVAVSALTQPPGPSTCPLPGSPYEGRALTEISDWSIAIDSAAPDTTPPTLHGADSRVVDATTARGAYVRYRNLYATDDVDPAPDVACRPAAGARFPIGRTAATCTATDDAGNSATQPFTVRVLGARGQLVEQKATVSGFALPEEQAQPLLGQLDRALRALGPGRRPRACRHVLRFERLGRSLAGDGLTAGQATRLVVAGDRIRTVLGCLPPPRGRARITLVPACDETSVDMGGGPYGASVELTRFPRQRVVGLDFFLNDGATPSFTFDFTTDANGHVAPWIGALPSPLGHVTVVAFRDRDADQVRDPGERVIASAELRDPCVTVPRPARQGWRARRGDRHVARR